MKSLPRHKGRSLFVAVGDHVVFDAIVDRGRDDASIKKVSLGMVWPVEDDASSPAWRHAGNLQQFIEGGVIDVRSQFGWRGR